MRLKELNRVLGSVEEFDRPDGRLEQYRTPVELAARVSEAMAWSDELEDKLVVDLGCGTGMLSMGSGAQGAYVIGTDVDTNAVQRADDTARSLGIWFDGIVADVCIGECVRGRFADSVVLNPPFGTKRRGIDAMFLAHAVRLARRSVYSMHKSSTRGFVHDLLMRWRCKPEVFAELRFPLARTLGMHKEECVDVGVDLWQVDVRNVSQSNVQAYIQRKSAHGGDTADRGRGGGSCSGSGRGSGNDGGNGGSNGAATEVCRPFARRKK